MSRKTIVSLLAAGALAMFALAPTSASAVGGHTATFAQGQPRHTICWLSHCVSPHPKWPHPKFTTIQPNGSSCWLSGCIRRPQHPRAYPTGPV
jgi:hypothetical protein